MNTKITITAKGIKPKLDVIRALTKFGETWDIRDPTNILVTILPDEFQTIYNIDCEEDYNICPTCLLPSEYCPTCECDKACCLLSCELENGGKCPTKRTLLIYENMKDWIFEHLLYRHDTLIRFGF